MSKQAELNDRIEAAVAAAAASMGTGEAEYAPVPLTAGEAAALIDHTLLKPEARGEQMRQLCAEADQYGFASVCVNPTWVSLCAELLQESAAMVCTVAGFPLGAMTTAVKAFEAANAVELGAQEVDMVLNVGRLRDGDWVTVWNDVAAVAEAVHDRDAILKVIFETCLLSDAEKIAACVLCQDAGADFVKTSTGFNQGGATLHDVALMRAVVGPEMGVKAAGGVRTAEDAGRMVAAGATRIGASAGVQIVQDLLGTASGETAADGAY